MSHRLTLTLALGVTLAVATAQFAAAGTDDFDSTFTRGGSGGADVTGDITWTTTVPADTSPLPKSYRRETGEATRYDNMTPEQAKTAYADTTYMCSMPGSFDAATVAANCATAPDATPTTPGQAPAPMLPSPRVLAGQAVLQLTLPSAMPSVGPDPDLNKWGMTAVGYPLWLWTDSQTQVGNTITVLGQPVTLTAVRSSVTYTMGTEGTVVCSSSTPWSSAVTPGSESPDCGYRFKTMGNHRVVAVATWSVTWSVMGQSGVIPVQKAGGTTVPVGELQAVNR